MLIGSLEGHQGALVDASWSPAGDRIVTVSVDGTARIWTAEGDLITLLPGDGAGPPSASWSRDGHSVAISSRRGKVKILTRDGVMKHDLRLGDGDISRVAWSPRGDVLAACAATPVAGGNLWLLSPQGGVQQLPGHEAKCWGVWWSPDGSQFATTSTDGSARVWTAEGALHAVLETNGIEVRALAWAPDGTHLATGSKDGRILDWPATDKALVELAEERISRPLYPEEQELYDPQGGWSRFTAWLAGEP